MFVRDLVVLGGVLVNLELAGDGRILPLNFNGLARLDVDGLVLLVQLIAGCGFQLAEVQPPFALDREIVDVNVPFVVRAVLDLLRN